MLSKKYWPHYKNMQTHFLMCKEKMRKKNKSKKEDRTYCFSRKNYTVNVNTSKVKMTNKKN